MKNKVENNFSIFTARTLLISISILGIFCTYTQNYGTKNNTPTPNMQKSTRSITRVVNAAKNTTKLCTYTTIGLLAGCNGILLGGISSYFLYKLREIKQSKISNAKFIVIKYICTYCTNTQSLNKYIIPVTIVTLSTGSICSFYTSYRMLKHAKRKLKEKATKKPQKD